jgi:hypothetical protein
MQTIFIGQALSQITGKGPQGGLVFPGLLSFCFLFVYVRA